MATEAETAIAITEAAYDLRVEDSDWLPNVMKIALPLIDQGLGVAGLIGTKSQSPGPPNIEQAHVEAMSPDFPLRVMRAMAELPPDKIHRQTESGIRLLSELTAEDPRVILAWRHHVGFAEDAVGITAMDPDGRGVHLMAPAPGRSKLRRAERRRWRMLAAHLCAGLRLRHADRRPSGPLPHGADAVLEPRDFSMTEVRPERSGGGLEGLREAAIRMDRARGPMRKAEPEEALETWWALVRGRWSVVDWFDTDDRRYVLGLRNPPSVKDPRGLTQRESQVVAYAAMGERHKMIAYRLGISRPHVTNAILSALRKLGVKTQAQLVEKLSGWPTHPTDGQD